MSSCGAALKTFLESGRPEEMSTLAFSSYRRAMALQSVRGRDCTPPSVSKTFARNGAGSILVSNGGAPFTPMVDVTADSIWQLQHVFDRPGRAASNQLYHHNIHVIGSLNEQTTACWPFSI
jgi:hypothetical protein